QVYVDYLKMMVCENNMQDRVIFSGPVFNEEKLHLLRQAWILVAPSYSEVIGMVNLESALCNTPSITTFETGLLNWESGGGILVHPETEELKNALIKISQWSYSERLEQGKKSFELVMNSYSWGAVFPHWDALYSGAIEV
ncbi:MAG TPA: glycosyltransferase, partial [Gammaproteobacteria bacterium]|nr:glycosyltransferase [Gammaproteobacteria bacterium]